MSWDVLIMRVPEGVTDLGDIPDDYDEPLCSHSELTARLRAVFPDIDLTDPTWGILEGEDYSIEFNMDEEDPCDSVMLHVRGGDSALAPIKALCDSTGWAAVDAGGGEIIPLTAESVPGFTAWQHMRQQSDPNSPLKGVRFSIPADNSP